jgi:hypothetical protein
VHKLKELKHNKDMGFPISNSKGKMMIEPFTDLVPSFFGMLNQGPLTLTIFLHTVIILPMFWIYKQEKAKLNK